jgi:hypothetical protein
MMMTVAQECLSALAMLSVQNVKTENVFNFNAQANCKFASRKGRRMSGL